MKRITLLAALVLAAVSTTFAAPLQLEHKFKKGEIDKYRYTQKTNMTMPGGGGVSVSASATMLQETLEVRADGSALIRTTINYESISAPGMDAESKSKIPTRQVITQIMSKDGKALGIQSASGMKIADNSGIQIGDIFGPAGVAAIFPAAPVSVGESWKNVEPISFGGGNMCSVSTLVADDVSLWSLINARIQQSFDGRIDVAQMLKKMSEITNMNAQTKNEISQVSGNVEFAGKSEILFSPERGKLLKSQSVTSGTIRINLPESLAKNGLSSLTMPFVNEFTITRFK